MDELRPVERVSDTDLVRALAPPALPVLQSTCCRLGRRAASLSPAVRMPRLDRMRSRTMAAYLFYGTLLTYILTASYTRQSIDTISTYIPAWQLAHHGSLYVDQFYDPKLWFVHVHGRVVSNRFPGAILFAVPFYLLLDHSALPLPFAGNVAAAAATAGSVTVLYLLLTRLTSGRRALGASLLFAFGTPTWGVSGNALWTHGPDQLWLLLGILALAGERYLPSGLAFAAAVLTRPHLALVPAAAGLGYSRHQKMSRPAILIACGSVTGVFGIVAYNRFIYGAWTLVGQYASHVAGAGTSTAHLGLGGVGVPAFLENIAGTLVSPSRGVIVLTPFLLLLVPGLRSAWVAAPPWARYPALGGLAYLASQLWLDHFSGGFGFYTYRVPIETLTLAGPLLTLAYTTWTSKRKWRRWAFLACAALSVGIQATGAVSLPASSTRPDFWRQFEPATALRSYGSVWVLVPLAATGCALFVARGLRER